MRKLQLKRSYMVKTGKRIMPTLLYEDSPEGKDLMDEAISRWICTMQPRVIDGRIIQYFWNAGISPRIYSTVQLRNQQVS